MSYQEPFLIETDTPLLTVFDSHIAIFAAIVISFVGNAVVLGMPIIVGSFADSLGFSEQQVGWLASADLGGMFLASVFTSTAIARINRRGLACAGIFIALLANYASIQFHEFEPLFLARVAAGIGGGICYSTGVACIAGTHHTARNFSILMFGLVAINAIELYTFPWLSDAWGINGIFYAFCVSFTGCFLVLPLLPCYTEETSLPPAHGNGNAVKRHGETEIPRYLPKLCLLAVSCFYITVGSFWAFIERAGVDAGLSDSFISNTLTVGTVFTLLGCIAATWLSNRAGQSKPLLAALLVMCAGLLMLSTGINPLVFALGTFIFNIMWLFTDIYQLGTISNIDHSGRFAALVPGAQGLAQTVAPAIAGFLLSRGLGYGSVMILGAAGSLGAFAIYSVVYGQLKRLAPDVADAG